MGMYMEPPPTFRVPELRYDMACGASNDNAKCLFLVVGVVFFYIVVMKPMNVHVPSARNVAAMITSVSRAASGAGAVQPLPSADVVDVDDSPAQVACHPKCKTDPDAWKSLSADEKKDVERGARAWLQEHTTALVLVFAPWCAHCTTAKAVVSRIAAERKMDVLMINAESVTEKALTGGDAIVHCDYFPLYAVHKDGKTEAVATAHEAVAQLEAVADADTEESAVAGMVAGVTNGLDACEPPTCENPFHDLF